MSENKGWDLVVKHLQEKHEREVALLNEQIATLREEYKLFWENKPVYAIVWSRDCDCCESTYAFHWESEKAYQTWLEDFYSYCEGPFTVSRCSKEEYEEFEGYERDRVLEAFENGNLTGVCI